MLAIYGIIAFVFTAVAVLKANENDPFKSNFKIINTSIMLIASITFTITHEANKEEALLIAGLSLSLIGDTLLTKEKTYLLGFLSFALAYGIYSFAIWNSILYSIDNVVTIELVFLIGLVLYLQINKYFIEWKTFLYLIILTALLSGAIASARPLLIIATSFLYLSDTLFAFDKFYAPIKHRDVFVLSTYWIGQFFVSIYIYYL